MPRADRIAAEALGLVGAPFRLRGRCPRTGLDCVGLVLIALRRAGWPAKEPPTYALRGTDVARASAWLGEAGLAQVAEREPGDILLAATGPLQLHLMICAGQGLVQAHAGLGRVVCMPPPPHWPIVGIWRVDPAERGG
jgi:murein DD-endopeptidase / murein LD-carboxypeptidase